MRTRLAQISYDVGDHPVLALDVADLFVSFARLRHPGCSTSCAVFPASAANTLYVYAAIAENTVCAVMYVCMCGWVGIHTHTL